jgi:general secretion pathway protein A
MYEEFFGLKEKPFNLTPDPRFFFLSENHREAFEYLLYGIKEKEGFILITGEVGAGKTLLCRALLDKIDATSTDTALILNPALPELQLLQTILGDFGIHGGGTKRELLESLDQFLLRQQAQNRHSILIVDEAQNLSPAALEEIRMLSNFETETEKLLQIIFLGQIELKEKLALPQLRQLNQRISVRYHIRALKEDEVPRYIQHRLRVAGSTGDIEFNAGALDAIYRYSQGIPRLVNLAADRALLAGYVQQSRHIGPTMVVKGLKSLQGEDVPLAPQRFWRRLALAAAGFLFLTVALLAVMVLADPESAWFFERIPNAGGSSIRTLPARSQLKHGDGELYSVQLGAYRTDAEAREAARNVDASGYPLFLSRVESTEDANSYRLYIGKFGQRAEAQGVADAFGKLGRFSATQVVVISNQGESSGP